MPRKNIHLSAIGLAAHFWVVMLRNPCRFLPFSDNLHPLGGYAPEPVWPGQRDSFKITFYNLKCPKQPRFWVHIRRNVMFFPFEKRSFPLDSF
ncbi:hypothetical protein [Gaoshiqia sp. Z1-71]|uniref:hypothetical protein n=1 Tax=Gaoshiqia hydrogeniformans TaxID=3290090 RepID=UPI003BF7CB0B